MDRASARPLLRQLDLADVDSEAHSQSLSGSNVAHRRRALESPRGTVEQREHPVARRIDLAAAEPVEQRSQRLIVLGQALSPDGVPQPYRLGGRADDVRHQEACEYAVV